jgi:hypothetical protein
MATNTDESVIQGIYDVQNIPTRLRKFAKDKDVFRFWVFRQLTTVTLLRIIAEKFGAVPSGKVSDWVFKYNEFDELDYMFSLSEASNSTDATNTKFKVTASVANLLGPETRLLIDGIYCTPIDGAFDCDTDMLTERSLSAGVTQNEVCRVVSVGDEDASGYCIVTVKRAHPADSYSNTPKAVTTSMTLTVVNLVARSNSKYLPVTNKNSKSLENVIQITRKSYGVGELLTKGGGIETYLSDGNEFLNNSYRLAEIYVTKTMERAMLEGRKSIKEVGEGMELETGGVIPFIPLSNYINWGQIAVNIANINAMIREVADAAGVVELWWFTGTKLSQQIANAYEDKRTFYTTNPTLTGRYAVKVNEIESTGRALTMFHVTAPVLNEIGKSNEGIILNLTEYNWNKKHKFGCFQVAYKTGEGFQDLPKDADSYESNTGYQGTIRELYTTWGLVRRLDETHFYTYNFPDVTDLLS